MSKRLVMVQLDVRLKRCADDGNVLCRFVKQPTTIGLAPVCTLFDEPLEEDGVGYVRHVACMAAELLACGKD